MKLKNMLNKELDGIVKSFDGNKKLSACAPPSEKLSMRRSTKAWLFSSCSAVAALCVALTVMLSIPRAVPPVTRYLTVEINPSVAFMLEDGLVERISALNSDCDIVLSDGFSNELIGKNAEQAVVLFADRAAKLGYMDLDAVTAVRVRSDGEYSLEVLENTLESYFMSKGAYAVVATGKLDGDLSETFANGDEYVRREIAGKQPEELAASYSSATVASVCELMRSGLSVRIDKIEILKSLLTELDEINEEIENHADNPITISPVKDYFVLDELSWLYPPESFGEDFARLTTLFKQKLDEYVALGGVMPTSGLEIKSAARTLDSISYDTLREIAANIADIATELYDTLAEILKYIGFDITDILGIADETPTNADEYVDNMEKLYSARSVALIDEYAASYGKTRAEISSADYESFVRDIIEQYGSTNDYYLSVSGQNN